MWKKLFPTLLLLLSGSICALGQTDAQTEAQPEKISVVLKDARPLVVEEIFESREGYWYKRGNVTTFLDRERVVRIDYPNPLEAAPASGPVQGNVRWRLTDAAKIQDFFAARFKRKLPTTAFGQSALHTRWGLDHRNGMDVGLHPDSNEGRALIEFLRNESIPFLAFRGPVPGVATGPHIHIGNRSPRVSGR